MATEETIDQLNSFLRGEISAVETYSQAIDKIDNPAVRSTLQQCRTSHQKRVSRIDAEIRRLGGSADKESGVWGSFAKLIEGGAKVFGEKAAVSVLEEGEDHGLKDYKKDRSDLDPNVRVLVEAELLPEQQRTHDVLSRLEKSL
ncbi:MAG: DUF2383 domain-containing protein [Polyangiales bacterium]